ncbi:META domain-containing protein [Nocardioides euryhalodurans]|uniref:META domain-containing protein n=1 Tax=Nocardioides euryhalodurans TaxID=2518370 RepID=A0A4P7GJS4_9ACTN|nr:META domain-containing protein [Nocardioides euryhalodurans]QBR92004.1 META domain-containing protein [Nocardioides euryhalodurans]
MSLRLLLLALLALSACGDGGSQATEDPDPPTPPPGDYVAVTLPEPYAAGDLLQLTVREDGVSFRATCNTFFGSADWGGGVLAVGQVGGTEMGCPGDAAAQDEWLVDFLTSRPTYAFDGEGLERAAPTPWSACCRPTRCPRTRAPARASRSKTPAGCSPTSRRTPTRRRP